MIDRAASINCPWGVAAGMLAAVLAMAGAAQAGGWDEFLKRCVTPMEKGGVPSILGLDLIDDPVGQGFDLPGNASMAVRPPFGTLGLQCQVVTQPIEVAKDAFDAWIATGVSAGNYTADQEIESRWIAGEAFVKPMVVDAWQEGKKMMLQISFLETAP